MRPRPKSSPTRHYGRAADIAPRTETVELAHQSIDVAGIELSDIVAIMKRFPDLRTMIDKKNAKGKVSMAALRGILLGKSTELIAGIITGGIARAAVLSGTPLSAAELDATERAASRMSLGEQAALLAAIMRLPASASIGPFVDLLLALGAEIMAPTQQSKHFLRMDRSSGRFSWPRAFISALERSRG
jgi:hypothetical protein